MEETPDNDNDYILKEETEMKQFIKTILIIAGFVGVIIIGRACWSLHEGVEKQATVPCYSMTEEPADGIFDVVKHVAGGAGLKRTTVFKTGDVLVEYKFADGRRKATMTMFGIEIPWTWLTSWD